MKAFFLSLVALALLATAASADECPLLQAQIDKAYGKRMDRQAATVKALAREGMALHKAGKHADSVKKYDEAAKAGAMTLTHKK